MHATHAKYSIASPFFANRSYGLLELCSVHAQVLFGMELLFIIAHVLTLWQLDFDYSSQALPWQIAVHRVAGDKTCESTPQR